MIYVLMLVVLAICAYLYAENEKNHKGLASVMLTNNILETELHQTKMELETLKEVIDKGEYYRKIHDRDISSIKRKLGEKLENIDRLRYLEEHVATDEYLYDPTKDPDILRFIEETKEEIVSDEEI